MKAKRVSRFMKKILSLALIALLFLPASPLSGYAGDSGVYSEDMQILKGDILTIPTKTLSRVSVTDPTIADISDAKPEQVTIVGKETGQTVVFIWDDSGKRTVIVRVVSEDLATVRARIQSLLESAGIVGVSVQENAQEGKVVLTGSLPEDKMTVLGKIIDPFSEQTINLAKQEVIEDLVQIDMQMTELSTTLDKQLGVDWAIGSSGASLSPQFVETLPAPTGKLGDLLKIGDFNRTNALVATVNALIKEGKARILSKPRLVVLNGKEATFLVGGEIPIRSVTSSTSGGTITENTEFKEYGISMAITPTIREGKVDIVLNVQISDIDASKPTGTDVAFLTRSAQTQLFLDDKQTIVLAGLIKKSRSEMNNRVPFFGSIPVLGLLFRSKKMPSADEDTEVVISLTPTILRSVKKEAIVAPIALPAPVIEPQITEIPEPSQDLEAENWRNNAGLPVITKNVAGVSVAVPEGIQPYARAVQEKISSAIAYPYEARENGWQGTAKLGLVIRRDGSLKDAFVKESSGYDVFDQDAVNTAQILAPYAPFPADFTEEQITITLPIVYSMDSFLKNVAKRN